MRVHFDGFGLNDADDKHKRRIMTLAISIPAGDPIGREMEKRINAYDEFVSALEGLPDDVDMIEDNPDEGERFFCCGMETHLNIGHLEHASGCWYVKARQALARANRKSQ